MHPAGPLLSLASLICRACSPTGRGSACLPVRSPARLQCICLVPNLPLLLESQGLNSPLFTAHCSSAMLGQVSQSLCHFLFFLCSWTQWDTTALSVWFLRWQSCCVSAHKHRVPVQSHLSSPFKRVSMWPFHCSTKSWAGSLHAPPPWKTQSLSWSGLSTACQCLWQI